MNTLFKMHPVESAYGANERPRLLNTLLWGTAESSRSAPL